MKQIRIWFAMISLPVLFSGAIALDKNSREFDIKSIQKEINGWTGKYNDFLDAWTFDKYDTSAGENTEPSRFYIDIAENELPRTMNELAEFAKKDGNIDYGFRYELDNRVNLKDGFVLRGKSIDTINNYAEPGFIVMRHFANVSVICKSGTMDSEDLASEAIEICKGL